MGNGPRPVYETGENVQFQWRSTWSTFNLTIVQTSHATQDKTRQRVYSIEPNTTSNFIWTAENFGGLSQDDPMHLFITNSEDYECRHCACRSQNFTVLDSTSSNTTSPLDGESIEEVSSGSDNHLSLGLGLGLGLGVPLLIMVTTLATWLCIRRRRRQQHQVAAYDDGSSGRSPSAMVPLTSTTTHTQPSSLGSASDNPEKSPVPEVDGSGVTEMQTDNARVEAPQNAVRAELAGNDSVERVAATFRTEQKQ